MCIRDRAWPLEKEMQFVDAVLDRYQGQVVTLTFGAVSASKFDSAALERLKQTYQNCLLYTSTICKKSSKMLTMVTRNAQDVVNKTLTNY